MSKNEVSVKWIGEDIEYLQPDWDKEKCDSVLDDLSKHLSNRVIELGNEVLAELVNEWKSENETDDEENE